MAGDQADMLARLKLGLTRRWFADSAPGADSSTPILDGLLNGPAWSWSWLYSLLQYVAQQRRIATAVGINLDQIALDFFGASKIARFVGEGDTPYRARIKANLLAPKGTRAAVSAALQALTNITPIIFEPANTSDTGGYGFQGMTQGTGLGYNVAGGYGSLLLPFQAFVKAYRPRGGGIANVQGYYQRGSGLAAYGGYGVGALEYASEDFVTGQVTDADIFATVSDTAPAATVLWVAISNQGGAAQLVLPVASLFLRQADNTLVAAVNGGSIVGRLITQQAAQVITGASNASLINAALTATQAAQTFGGAIFVGLVWSSADETGMTVSNQGLTATTSSASQSGIRATFPKSAGSVYCEVTNPTAGASERVGFANPVWATTAVLGSDNNSIGINSTGAIFLAGTQIATGPTWAAGNTLGFAIDIDTKKFWYRINNGPWGGAAATGVTGSNNTGTADPVITGPASGVVTAGGTLNVTGVSLADSNWPHAGNCTLNVGCTSGTVSMTLGGSAVAGSGTASISLNDTSANEQSAIATLVYSAPASPGSDTISIQVYDQFSNTHTLNIPITVQAVADPATNSGGFSFSSMAATPYMMAFAAAAAGSVKVINGGSSAFAATVPAGYTAWTVPAGGAPAAPTGVTPSKETANSVTLTWTPSTG